MDNFHTQPFSMPSGMENRARGRDGAEFREILNGTGGGLRACFAILCINNLIIFGKCFVYLQNTMILQLQDCEPC